MANRCENKQHKLGWYRRILVQDPTNEQVLYQIPNILYDQESLTDREMQEGIECATKGYTLGSLICWNLLALFYQLQHRYDEAFIILSELVQQPNALHCWYYNFARCFEDGNGTRQDFNQAKEWYQKAIAGGNKSAKAALARLG